MNRPTVVLFLMHHLLLQASAPQISVTLPHNDRTTSQELVVKSTLKGAIKLGRTQALGEVYDMHLIEDDDERSRAIIAYTTKQLKLTITIAYVLLMPRISVKHIADKPRAPSKTFSCLSKSNEWRIVLTRIGQSNMPATYLSLETYQNTTQKLNHLDPMFNIPGHKIEN